MNKRWREPFFLSSVFIQLGKQWLWFGLERSLFHSGSNFIPTQNTIRMGWGENQAEARASEMANKRGNKLGMKYSGWSEQKVEREGNREITKARNTQEREWRGSKWLLSTPPHLLKFSFHDEMWENSLYKSELEVTKTNPNWQVTAYISLSLSLSGSPILVLAYEWNSHSSIEHRAFVHVSIQNP